MLTTKKQPWGRRLRAVGLGCALLLGLASGCTPPGPRAFSEGKHLLERGQYVRAAARLHVAVVALRTNAQAYYFLGLACQYAGQTTEAERAYREALSLEPDLTEAHYNLGCLFFSENRLDSARTEFLAYTLRRDNAVEGYLRLGTVELCMRETTTAEKSFDEALRLSPRNSEALNGLALVRLQRGRFAEAARALEVVCQQEPVFAPAMLNLAIILQQYQFDKAGALKWYRQYLALKPTPENAEAVRAVVRQLEKELAPAAGASLAFTNSLVSTPLRTGGTNRVGQAVAPPKPEPVASAGAAHPGAASSSRAEPVAPTNRVESVTLSAEPVFKPAQDEPLLVSPGNVAGASNAVVSSGGGTAAETAKPVKRSFFQRLFGLKPKAAVSPVPAAAADELAQAGFSDAGLPAPSGERYAYRPVLVPEPGNPVEAQRSFAQGVQAQQNHHLAEAIEFYRRATQQDPAFFEAYYNLGLACSEAGHMRATMVAYENALMVRPGSADARYNFALALQRANYLSDAAEQLEKLLKQTPGEIRAHLALANLYAGPLREPSKARPHYRRVLRAEPAGAQAQAIRRWLAQNP